MATLTTFPTVLSRSLPFQQACLACAKRQASKSARAKRRPKLEVELTSNVEHLGSAGQRVQVAPGRMRNHLYPSKLALYVLSGRTMRLDGSLGPVATPSTLPSKGTEASSTASLAMNATTSQQRVEQVENVGPLLFTRRTTVQDTIHGSVTAQNVLSVLQDRGIALIELSGDWQGRDGNQGIEQGKVKKLGEYIFNATIHSKKVPIIVRIQNDDTSHDSQ